MAGFNSNRDPAAVVRYIRDPRAPDQCVAVQLIHPLFQEGFRRELGEGQYKRKALRYRGERHRTDSLPATHCESAADLHAGVDHGAGHAHATKDGEGRRVDADGPRMGFPLEPLFQDADFHAFLEEQRGEVQTHWSAAHNHHVRHRDGPGSG